MVYTYKWGILLAVNHLDSVLHNVSVHFCDCGNESEATECVPVVLQYISAVKMNWYLRLHLNVEFVCVFQIIDGQQVEVMAGEEDEDEDDDTDGEMMAVEGQDGQQYVVLEVIQLQVKNTVK